MIMSVVIVGILKLGIPIFGKLTPNKLIPNNAILPSIPLTLTQNPDYPNLERKRTLTGGARRGLAAPEGAGLFGVQFFELFVELAFFLGEAGRDFNAED